MATPISGMDVYAPVFKVKQNGEEYPVKESILSLEIDEDWKLLQCFGFH